MRQLALVVAAAVILEACATPGEKTAIGAGGAIGNYLDKQDQELKQVAETRRTENGLLVNLKSSLLFSFDSAVLKPDAVEQIAQLGDILARYPEDRIRIEGHSDSEGTAAHNEELSLRRAEAVRDLLASRGVNPRQMLVIGAGSSRPIASNATEQGRAENRRVEIHIDVPQKS